MLVNHRRVCCFAWQIAVLFAMPLAAQPPKVEPTGQRMLELPVQVVDANGGPVTDAKISPWALRSSQGHGWWGAGDKSAAIGPADVFTDAEGNATVLYPRFRYLGEQIRTVAVTLHVDHPDFAYVDFVEIDVPLEQKVPYEIKLTTGVPLDIRPLIDGKPVDPTNVFAFWSDGRSWRKGLHLKKSADSILRIPAMPPGDNSVLLVKLEGDRATHFSKITDFELTAGEPKQLDIALQPAVQIKGKLSGNVPRPVRNGRMKLETLDPALANSNRVMWLTWVPIQPDGSFIIDGWPADERLQLIALCDGYIATSGAAPDVVKNPPDPKTDSFGRPQVFEPRANQPIEVAMTPLVGCPVKAVDQGGSPVAGVRIVSWPNVCWWNSGSQIYCHPLVRGERLLREREYHSAVENVFATPFEAQTDAQGKATLELPAGHEHLEAETDIYELPALVGHRDVRIEITRDNMPETVLRLQPKGTDKLGEWDKLAGVIFGCGTREAQRICALPGVQKKMEEFADRFREAKNRNDPQLLSEAYALVADAFLDVGDLDEAAKWRQKADGQAAKAATSEKATGEEPAGK